jgi:DNA mismatch repair protein MSH2
MNLLGFLDQCQTAQGSRLVSQWIKQPLLSLEMIYQRQDLVEMFMQDTAVRQSLRVIITYFQDAHLKKFPDLFRICKKFQRGVASLQDVVRIYQVLISLPDFYSCLDECTGKNSDLVRKTFSTPLLEYIEALEKLKVMVEETIDLEAADSHEYIIKGDFHEELAEIRTKMNNAQTQMQSEAEKVAIRLEVEFGKKLKFEHNSQYGHHLRISRNEASKIRGDKTFVELSTQKAGVNFTTPKLKQLSTDYDDFSTDYKKLQTTVAKEIIAIASSYSAVLDKLNDLVAYIDVVATFAYVSKHAAIEYIRPTMKERGMLSLLR